MLPAGPHFLAVVRSGAAALYALETEIMKVEIVNDNIVITMPIAKHTSKSGKSTIVASSGGNQPTAAVVDGQPVIVGCNCYIRKV